GFTPENFEFTVRNATDSMGFENGYTFVELDDGSAMITGADVSGDVVLPAELNGKKVTAIGEGAFYKATTITSLTIPDGIESIGIYAFSDCTALGSVSIPKSVWSIEPFAFEGTPWLAAQTDEFVTAGDDVLIAYNGTSNTPVLPDTVRHLGGAFAANEAIRSLTLGRGVLTVSSMALAFCKNLALVDPGLSLVYVGEQAFSGDEKLTSLVFPDTLRCIGPQACLNCYELKYLYLGQSLCNLGQNAFEYCQALRTVFIPESLTELRSSHFKDCPSLCLVLYGGSEARFDSVAINDNESSFKRINKVFNYTGGINE
ncbi:MAG: leucine-rich repeat domain-containing protein, partial [Eubacteriales bacterium]